MATRKIAAEFSVTGEKAYKQALSEINGGLRVLQSEMRLASAEFKGNEQNAGALGKQQEILNKILLKQQDKVKTLETALEEAVKAYGENSKKAMEYQKSLNSAKASLIGFQSQLDETADAIKGIPLAELGKSLKSIDAQFDVLSSELSLINASYTQNSNCVDVLQEKYDTLGRMISAQQAQVEALEKAVKEASTAYGEGSEKTLEYQKRLNEAKASLLNFQAQLDETADAIRDLPFNALNESLKTTDTQMGVLDSQLALINAKYGENANSIEALCEKNDTLGQMIGVQKKQVEALEKAVEDAAAAYGEGSDKALNYQKALNNAKAALVKTKHQLDSTSKALKDTGDAMDKNGRSAKGLRAHLSSLKDRFAETIGESKGLGDAVTDLTGKFGLQLPDGIQSTLNSMGSINPVAMGVAGGLAALAVACVKAEKAFMDLTRESAAFADNILTLSSTTGLGTDALQEFQYASELLDVSMDTLEGSLSKTVLAMREAESGTGKAYEAFRQLGIQTTDLDGSLRDSRDVYMEVIDALGGVQNATERDALAMSIFGESAQKLNPLIQQGSKALAEYSKEAHNMGYVLDNEALSALGAVDDAQQKLLKAQEAVSNQISTEYAPYMEKALGDTKDFILDIGKAFSDTEITESFGSILTSASGLLEPLGELVKVTLPALDVVLKPIAKTMALIADASDVLVGLLTWDWSRVKQGLGLGMSEGNLSHQQELRYKNSGWMYNPATGMWEGNYGRNASGDDNWRGGVTWVGENGPEKVYLPQGSQILSAQESRQGGGDIYNITIDARSIQEFEDVVRIVKEHRRLSRMGGGR